GDKPSRRQRPAPWARRGGLQDPQAPRAPRGQQPRSVHTRAAVPHPHHTPAGTPRRSGTRGGGRAPWLEQIYCRGALRDSESRRLLTTHLPAPVLAPALQRSKAKVIYVARNPKDVAVSFYHFHRLAKFLPDPSSFDAFLTQFLEGTGEVHYGSWFDHVKGWLGQRHLLDILYVTYEELHQDLRGTAQRLSTFLGCPLAPGTLEALEQHCSFSASVEHPAPHASVTGVVGDWRGHFSPDTVTRSWLLQRDPGRSTPECPSLDPLPALPEPKPGLDAPHAHLPSGRGVRTRGLSQPRPSSSGCPAPLLPRSEELLLEPARKAPSIINCPH
uniref:Sulfotransferase n=1 Tax=Malurus cyaneus samueli TaxID=2593467 RepID=A0A8C5SY70_9PASS